MGCVGNEDFVVIRVLKDLHLCGGMCLGFAGGKVLQKNCCGCFDCFFLPSFYDGIRLALIAQLSYLISLNGYVIG